MPKTQTKDPPADRATGSQQAEYKYIGDDGGRFVFERRSDKRVVTIDKPKILPKKNPSRVPVNLMVHGFRVNDDVIALCKK